MVENKKMKELRFKSIPEIYETLDERNECATSGIYFANSVRDYIYNNPVVLIDESVEDSENFYTLRTYPGFMHISKEWIKEVNERHHKFTELYLKFDSFMKDENNRENTTN